MSENILETLHLTYLYGNKNRPALNDVNIKIRSGVKTVILGANGAGKSTLFYHFNGVYIPSTGVVDYDGTPMSYKKKSLRALRSGVAVVLQNPDDQIFCSTVEEDVGFGPKNMGLSENEVKERVDEALFQTGMTMLRKQGTMKLSYGQRKRLTLAGAIAMRPKLLILDEPTAGLDPQMAHEVMELADQLHYLGTTVVLSTHDVDLAYEWADEIHVLRMGRLIYSGNSEGFYQDARLVHTAGLMPPSMYSINRNYMLMTHQSDDTYPRSLPEIISKISITKKKPGELFIVPVDAEISPDILDDARMKAGDVRIGAYGTAARREIFRNKMFCDYVFNGIDNCLIETVNGNNAILFCEDRVIGIVLGRVERLKKFGCSVSVSVL